VGTGRLGVIAGSGVAATDLADGGARREVDTARGPVIAHDRGEVIVIGRHGERDPQPAHRVDHAANTAALAELGCDRVLALASTGSLRADWPVGTVVFPDDFFGPWVTPSIFDDTRGHTVPGFDAAWRSQAMAAWTALASTPAHEGGVYVHATGPRFETPAEIRFFATVGDLVGMTLGAECILAKETGLAYAAVCIVDNMANGIGDVTLTTEAFQAGVAANRAQFVDDVTRVVQRLVEES
jgi:5'-methylthioadenosine phosphorylase